MSTLPRTALATIATALAITLVGCGGNRNWSNNNGSQTLTCASDDGRNHSCRAGFRIDHANIDKQIYKSSCDFGRTWGYNNDKIWVDQGCQARFRVYAGSGSPWNGGNNGTGNGGGNGGGGGNGNGGGTIIRCESNDGRRQNCKAGFKIARIEIARQLSKSSCNYGNDWGNESGRVWVDHGCRADFRAYRR